MSPEVILFIHIVGGAIALLSGFFSALTKQFSFPHKWHVYSGRAFMFGYVIIFLTALLLLFFRFNSFLFFVALFSFYLAITGFRYAKNKKGVLLFDWFLQISALLIFLLMIGFGVFSIGQVDTKSYVAIIFGIIGLIFCIRELFSYKNKKVFKGITRIVRHLNFMLGASIGTVTAFVVTNFDLQPAFILWLAPTVVMVPYIIYWSKKLTSTKKK